MCWFLRKFPLREEDLAPMIRGHQITLELAQQVQLPGVLNDLHNNSSLRRDVAGNPMAFLQSRGVTLPMGATVEFRILQADGWEMEVKVVEGPYAYINGFNNEKGFYRVQGPQRPRAPENPSSSV